MLLRFISSNSFGLGFAFHYRELRGLVHFRLYGCALFRDYLNPRIRYRICQESVQLSIFARDLLRSGSAEGRRVRATVGQQCRLWKLRLSRHIDRVSLINRCHPVQAGLLALDETRRRPSYLNERVVLRLSLLGLLGEPRALEAGVYRRNGRLKHRTLASWGDTREGCASFPL